MFCKSVENQIIMKKKKILYIVEAMGGGIFTYMVGLTNLLSNEYDMYIAYAIRPQTPSNYRDFFNNNIHLVEVKNFQRKINPYKDIKSIIEIKKVVDEIKPDIIHLHSSKAGALGRIAFNGKKIPVFYTPHGYSFLMENYKPIKRKIFWLIEKFCAKKKCCTISCSVGEHKETLGLTSRALYVNNAINTNELDRLLENVKEEVHPFTVFTLGRICYQKNPTLFNKIANKMQDVKFLWIGDGELRSELKSPNIEITGWIDRNEALKRSENADVFLLTSRWEGLPMSLLEAMYMKKICVVSDVIGNKDVIENGVNGYVCHNIEEFIDAIKERNEKYINNAYDDLIKKYSVDVQAEGYSKIYRKAIREYERYKI